MKRRNALISLIVCALCAAIVFTLSSCGNTNPGPAVGTFKTVTISPSILTPLLPVAVFVGETCTDNVLSGTFTPVAATPLQVTLTSTLYPNETVGQPVNVTTCDIYFTPLDGGPAISPMRNVGVGVSVPPGGSVLAPVNMVDLNTVGTLQNNPTWQQCGTPQSFHYTAQIVFHGTELGGTNATFTAYTEVIYTNGTV